jgi:hypothetical protein
MRDGGGGARLHGVCGSERDGRKSYAKPVGIGEVYLARASARWSRRICRVTPPGRRWPRRPGKALGFANTGSQQHGYRGARTCTRSAFLLPADWPIASALNLHLKGGAFVHLGPLPRQRRRAPSGVAGIDTSSRWKFSGVGGPLGRDASTICLTALSLMFSS